MSAQTHLATYGVTVQQAQDFIIANLSSPSVIFNTCAQFHVTNQMIVEIFNNAYSLETVKGYFNFNGLNADILDNASTNSILLPTTLTDSYGVVYDIVLGTSGNDVFSHSNGNKLYLGSSGNDTFTNTKNASGSAIFIGGAGNDTYNIYAGGEVFVKDSGGGNDTYNAYTISSPGYNYIFDNRFIGTAFTNPANSSVIIGDLTNQNDLIEAINFPGITTSSITYQQSISFMSQQSNWLGSTTSEALFGTSASVNFYHDLAVLVGVYDQYTAAGY